MEQTPIKPAQGVHKHSHFVQYYKTDESLITNLEKFLGEGLEGGSACVAVVTREHRLALEQALSARGIEVADRLASGDLVILDAQATLNQFMRHDAPDRLLFRQTIGGLLQRYHGRDIKAYGEMVALLWEQNNQIGAVMLEELWNDIGNDHNFSLFCAYPLHFFDNPTHAELHRHINLLHTSSIAQ